MEKASIAVIGTTTWGTTLAMINARMGKNVTLVARTAKEASALTYAGENSRFLPGIKFPEALKITNQVDTVMSEAQIILIAVPSASFRENLTLIADIIPSHSVVVIATKGLEYSSGKRMSEILCEEVGHHSNNSICTMSGPNLANEIIMGKPSSTVIACTQPSVSRKVQSILKTDNLRIYTNSDVIGVEISGAVKNTIAIAAGISDGLELGNNAKASLITRGLSEITRLGTALGADQNTFYGLSGIGDLIATCSSPLSRNNQVGRMLAKGMRITEIIGHMDNVAEGIDTTKAIVKISKQKNLEMPIAEAVNQVITGDLRADEAVKNLMLRDSKSEIA